MATQAEIAVLRGTATQVKNESQVGGNTAGRVGGLFERIVDALPSDEVIDGKISEAVSDIQPIVIEGNVDNAPDQEDLTSANQGGTDVLKFKDKTYAPALFSGLGRVYLRKNVVTPENLGYAINLLTAEMVAQENTIYHIQYDYDLNGHTITLPAGCVLEFDGGSVKNGTLVGNLTEIRAGYQCIMKNVTPNGTWKNEYIFMEWLGYDHVSDGTSLLEDAFEWGLPIKLLDAKYYFASLVVLPYGMSMIGSGDETKVYTSGFGFGGLNTFSQMAVLPYSSSVGCLFDIDSHYLRTSNNAKICINNVYAEADILEDYGDVFKLTAHSTNTISLGGFYNVNVQNVRSKGNFANGIHFYSEQESGQPAWITYCSFADCFFEKLKSLIKFECAAGANYNIPIFEGHKFLNITCQYYPNYTENVVVIEGVHKCLFDGVECVDRGTSIPMFSVANALSTFAVVNATTGDVLSSNYVVKTYSGETAAKDLFHQHVRLFSSLTDGLEYITPVKNGNLAHFIQKAPTYNGNIQFIEYGSTDSAKAFIGVLLTPSLTNTNKGSRGLVGINGLGQLVGRTIAVSDNDDYSEIACERLVTFRTFPTIQGMTLLDAELKANGRMVCLTSSDLCMPMWYNLSTNRWNNALGVQVTNKITRSVGTSDQRTALGIGNATCVGFCYFDTTLGKPLWWNGTGWVDATGAPVANSLKVLAITQSAYDALTTKDANTLYVITQ